MALCGRFPRTPHVVNGPLRGGAVTRDDLTIAEEDADAFVYLMSTTDDASLGSSTTAMPPTLTVEEKLDGANLGISLADDGGTLQCQNRSHYVNGATSAQWAGLPQFLSEVKSELLDLLYAVPEYAEVQAVIRASTADLPPIARRGLGQPPPPTAEENVEPHPSVRACDWIVFGEWLAAQHSVYYDLLPSPFLIFDLYHVPSQRFLSADLRNVLVARHCPSLRCVHRVASWQLSARKPRGGRGRKGNTADVDQPPAGAGAGVAVPSPVLTGWGDIHALWHMKPSRYFDANRSRSGAAAGRSSTAAMMPRMMEGVVMRLDYRVAWQAPQSGGDLGVPPGFQIARCKAVHDEFVAAVDEGGHWRKQALVKNIVVGTSDE